MSQRTLPTLPGRYAAEIFNLRRWTPSRETGAPTIRFVVKDGKSPKLVQVSADITSHDTRQRELVALQGAMSDRGVREGTIVTLTAEETLKTAASSVFIVPAPLWLLAPPG